jgi:hypothetical protein
LPLMYLLFLALLPQLSPLFSLLHLLPPPARYKVICIILGSPCLLVFICVWHLLLWRQASSWRVTVGGGTSRCPVTRMSSYVKTWSHWGSRGTSNDSGNLVPDYELPLLFNLALSDARICGIFTILTFATLSSPLSSPTSF